jgi:glucose-1-phosphate cytidylyltransferase
MQSETPAGGLKTRLAKAALLCPKPMVLVGGKPMLWRVMKLHSHYGVNDFVDCAGYKGDRFQVRFANYLWRNSVVNFDLDFDDRHVHTLCALDWGS